MNLSRINKVYKVTPSSNIGPNTDDLGLGKQFKFNKSIQCK